MKEDLLALLPASGAMPFDEWVAQARAQGLRPELWTRLKHDGFLSTYIDDATGVHMIRKGAQS